MMQQARGKVLLFQLVAMLWKTLQPKNKFISLKDDFPKHGEVVPHNLVTRKAFMSTTRTFMFRNTQMNKLVTKNHFEYNQRFGFSWNKGLGEESLLGSTKGF